MVVVSGTVAASSEINSKSLFHRWRRMRKSGWIFRLQTRSMIDDPNLESRASLKIYPLKKKDKKETKKKKINVSTTTLIMKIKWKTLTNYCSQLYTLICFFFLYCSLGSFLHQMASSSHICQRGREFCSMMMMSGGREWNPMSPKVAQSCFFVFVIKSLFKTLVNLLIKIPAIKSIYNWDLCSISYTSYGGEKTIELLNVEQWYVIVMARFWKLLQ